VSVNTTTGLVDTPECVPYDVFTNIVKQKAVSGDKLVYVATDELDPAVLKKLSDAGFKTYLDAHAHGLTSLGRYVLDLMMMAASTHQIFLGSSKYKEFFDRVHQQKYQQFSPDRF
jgi:KaiC/GvpD/RAD55 family RecA-like ATPase